MIEEDYVDFETAKLLKEKGFDWESFASIKVFCGSKYEINGELIVPKENTIIPTLQIAMKWLREKHNLYVDIILHSVNRTLIYEARIDKINSPSYIDVILPQINEPIYENACESAIKYCLENLI